MPNGYLRAGRSATAAVRDAATPPRLAALSSRRFGPLVLLLAVAGAAPGVNADQPWGELVVAGRPAAPAQFLGCTGDGSLRFDAGGDAPLAVDADALVRWSTPAASRGSEDLYLTDGSRIRLAPAWAGNRGWTVGADVASITGHQLGDFQVPRERLLAMGLKLPPNEVERRRRIDELLRRQSEHPASDLLVLDNGDLLAGELKEAGGPPQVAVLHSEIGRLEVPLARVSGIALAKGAGANTGTQPPRVPRILVGLGNGSLIAADSMAADGERVLLRSRSLGEVRVAAEEITSLQGFGECCEYLSQATPIGYKHTPYLELPWSFTSDRNVLGGLLRVGGKTYLKGLGLHSASEITYALDGRFDTFAATIAVDDAAEGGGSIIARVLLQQDGGAWREAFASGVLRGGGAAVAASVPLAGAARLKLVVDYADRGDERDYADWLDARLERTADDRSP